MPVAKTDVWLTPPDLLNRLGRFDLDPCSPDNRPWDTAGRHYTKADNGLLLPWFGRVWLNPPYGRYEIEYWMQKMADHSNGISLVFSRTCSAWFQQYVFGKADSILFVAGRIKFFDVTGQQAKTDGGSPSVLIAYGEENIAALADSGIKGRHVLINAVPVIVVGISGKWKHVVSIALTRLNGEGNLQQIYDLVERIAPDKVSGNKFYKEKVRQQLQMHFSRISNGIYSNDQKN